MGGYQSGALEPKAKTDESGILPGSIRLEHLSADLFRQIKAIGSHAHEGTSSRELILDDLEGNEIYLYSANGTRWQLTISNAGALVITSA